MPACPEVPWWLLLAAAWGFVSFAAYVLYLTAWGAWLWFTRKTRATHVGQIKRSLFR